jgi:hypothetical protein
VPRGDAEKPNSATSTVHRPREPGISFLFSTDVTRAKLEAAGFRVVTWQDTTAEALESAARRSRNATTAPPPLGTHLILGDDWRQCSAIPPAISKSAAPNSSTPSSSASPEPPRSPPSLTEKLLLTASPAPGLRAVFDRVDTLGTHHPHPDPPPSRGWE